MAPGHVRDQTSSAPRPRSISPMSADPSDSPSRPSGREREEHRVVVQGTTHRYLLDAPQADPAEGPRPLVLDLHGHSEGADLRRMWSGVAEHGLENGYVTATPEGTGQPPQWDVASQDNTSVPVIEAVIDDVASVEDIDQSRVFAVGLSNGAFLCSLLATELAHRIAGIGAAAGLRAPLSTKSITAVPIIALHGDLDATLPLAGGVGSSVGDLLGPDGFPLGHHHTLEELAAQRRAIEPIEERAAAWAQRYGCDPDPAVESHDGWERIRYSGGAAPVELVVVRGAGHTWPGSAGYALAEAAIGPTPADPDAIQLIWDFFSTL